MKTDNQLKQDVMDEILWDPTVTSTDIAVTARGGVVTLSGTVPYYAEKWATERAAQRVNGVKAIAEEIVVNPLGDHKKKDEDIAQAAMNALRWHVWVPKDVQVKVEDGWLSLVGTSRWGYERDAAANAVRFLSGVKGVTNNIVLKPSVKPMDVKNAIEKRLKQDAEIDAAKVKVTADGGCVTLTGNARSWHERKEIESAAWGTPGVTTVMNTIAITT